MKLSYKPQAVKQLKKLPLSESKKVIKKLELLKTEPSTGKTLRGELKALRSLRAWPYRIIYKLTKNTIVVYSITH